MQRSVDLHMEMIFRHGIYHADPQSGNFLIADSTHLRLIDVGDVGRESSDRRRQLEDIVISIGIRDTELLHHHRLVPPADLAVLTWVVMPALTRRFSRWLEGPR